MSTGKSLRVFLVDGKPGGMITAEIMNWTGHVISAPRSDLGVLLKREETKRTGVYVLVGDPEGLGKQRAYIGEGDDVARRLYSHGREEKQGGKAFWDRVFVLTSKDANLTKAHARYLEARLIKIAADVDRVQMENGTAPDISGLPESDLSDMEYFIQQAQIVFPVLGLDMFRATRPTADDPDGSGDRGTSPIFVIETKAGVAARGQAVDGQFVVLGGSAVRTSWVGVPGTGYTALRAELEVDGTIGPNAAGLTVFTRDHAFASPSAAAAIVLGRSANGRSEWRSQVTGETFGQWETAGADDSIDQA